MRFRLEDYDEDLEEIKFEKFSRKKKTKMKVHTKEDKKNIKKPTGVMKFKKNGKNKFAKEEI